MSSLSRIYLIARNTLTEAMRQRVLNILLLFALVAIASAFLFDDLTLEADAFKFIKDFSLGAMSVFGLLIALMSTAALLPTELENRTVYTILAKPVHRAEFLLGKFLGVLVLLAVALFLMSVVFFVVLFLKEQWVIGPMEEHLAQMASSGASPEALAHQSRLIEQAYAAARDPDIFQALLLIYAKLAFTASIAMVISTFATSTIFTVATTFMIYLIGHLQSTARETWQAQADEFSLASIGLGVLVLLLPDMNTYSLIDEILAGTEVLWADTLQILALTVVRIAVYLGVAVIIFQDREL
ncbi:MAG: ABC transporter permease subunit [Verrucomicrobiota bacterium]